MNGGNGGCMEAMAIGCRRVKDSRCIGVTVPTDLPVESTPYVTETIQASNMLDRINILCTKSDIIVALPGYLGTLNEILMAITFNYITDANGRPKKRMFVSRQPWEPIWKSICDELNVRME